MLFESLQMIVVGRQPTARGDHRPITPGQGLDHLALAVAKARLSLLTEDLADAHPGFGLNQRIRIQEVKLQLRRHQPAY